MCVMFYTTSIDDHILGKECDEFVVPQKNTNQIEIFVQFLTHGPHYIPLFSSFKEELVNK